MITWFQRVFGKHFKWVLLIFLGVLFVSFIVSIGAVPRLSMQGGQGKAEMFLGVDTSDPQVIRELAYAVQFTYQNIYNQQISNPQDLERLVNYRIVIMHLADEWHIPEPTTAELEAFLRSARAFRDADGHFSVEIYQKFKDNVETAPTRQRDLISAILKEECRLERVRSILGGPGYVVPFVPLAQIALSQIKSDLEVATLDYKSFEAKIELTGDQLTATLQELFAKDPTKFPRPAQVNLSYVKFPSAGAGDPTAAQLLDFAKQHKNEFPDINPELLTDKDKTAVTESWRKDQVRQLTLKFARELYDIIGQLGGGQLKLDAPQFKSLLTKYNLTLNALPTIIVGEPVAEDSPISNDVLQDAAMSLNASTPPRPALLKDGTAVLFYVNSTPPHESTFEEARADVLKAYTDLEKQRQFTELCTTKREALVKEVAAGKTFAQAAKDQGFTVKNYANVTMDEIEKTLNDMPFGDEDKSDVPLGPLAAMGRDTLTALYSSSNSTIPLIMALHTGETSPVLTQGNTGVVFYVTKRAPAEVTANTPEVQKMDRTMAEREKNVATIYAMESLLQSFKQAAK